MGSPGSLLVKICGTRKAETAIEAIKAGADLIGMILVPGRGRHVPYKDAIAISKAVHETRVTTGSVVSNRIGSQATDFFANAASNISSHRALLVGVFQNQPLEEILELQKAYELDIVQLHGQEPVEWANLIPVPVIRVFNPTQPGIGKRGYHTVPLLDSLTGGSGKTLDLTQVSDVLAKDPGLRIMLAGGLNADNVADAVRAVGDYSDRIIGVDTASGVEENGVQSVEKIQAFIRQPRVSGRRLCWYLTVIYNFLHSFSCDMPSLLTLASHFSW